MFKDSWPLPLRPRADSKCVTGLPSLGCQHLFYSLVSSPFRRPKPFLPPVNSNCSAFSGRSLARGSVWFPLSGLLFLAFRGPGNPELLSELAGSRALLFGELFAYAICHYSVLTEALGIQLRCLHSDSAFRYFFRHS